MPYFPQPGLGFAQDPSAYAGNLDYSMFPAPPGFTFGSDPASQQMIAAQNQAASQLGYLGQVYGPYLQGMLNQGAALAPSAATPVFDREMKGLRHTAGAGRGKEAAAGLAVLDAQTQAGHIAAHGLADAGQIYQSAQPAIGAANEAQAQQALYGQFSQNAVALAGQQAGQGQSAVEGIVNAIGQSAQAGQPMTSEQISSLAQVYGLAPDEVAQLQTYAQSVASQAPSTSAHSLAELNPAWSTVDQQVTTFVQQSKGKTLAEVQRDVYGELANGGNAYILANPQVKHILDMEIAAIWTASQQAAQAQQGLGSAGAPSAGAAGAMQAAAFGAAPQQPSFGGQAPTSFGAAPPTNFG